MPSLLRYSVLVASFCLCLPGAEAQALDWTKYVEFRDVEDPTTTMTTTVKAWQEEEKIRVREILQTFPDGCEGLIQRAAAFKPLRFYRAADPKFDMPGRAGSTFAWAVHASYGVYFQERFFTVHGRDDPEFLRWTLFHEIVHLADIGPTDLSESREWAVLVDERIKQARANIAALPPSSPFADQQLAAGRAGVPSTYAAQSRSEALAEYGTVFLLGKSVMCAANFETPPEIRTYLADRIYSLPYTPDRSYQLVYEGVNLRDRQSKLNEAIANANEAIRLNPKNRRAYYLRGGTYMLQQRNQEAIADLEKTFSMYEIDGWYRTKLHKDLGELYGRLKDDDRSLEHLRQAVASAPQDANAQGLLAGELTRVKKFDEAIEAWDKVIALTKTANKHDRAKWLLARAGVKLDKSDLAAAQVDLDAVVALDPADPVLYAARGYFWKARGNHEQFEAEFARAIELAPKDLSLIRARGDARQARDAHREALADYEVILAANKMNLEVVVRRGKSRLALGEYDAALADAEAVLKILRGLPIAVQLRADVRIATGDREKCLAELDELITKSPQTVVWQQMRADALKRLDAAAKAK